MNATYYLSCISPRLLLAPCLLASLTAAAIAGDNALVVDFDQTGADSPLVVDEAGPSGRYAAFDSGDDKPEFDLSFVVEGSFTMAARVRGRAWPAGDNDRGFGADAPATVLGVLSDKRQAAAVLRVRNGQPELSIEIGPGKYTSLTADEVLPLNQWVHLAATYDGQSLSVYIDGQPVRKRKVPTLASPGVRAAIGALGQRRFVGDLDELVVTPFAMTDDQIQHLANTPSANAAIPDSTNQPPEPQTAPAPVDSTLEQILQIHPDSVHPVLDGNYDIVAVPGPGGRTDLWVMTTEPYRLRPIGPDNGAAELNQPNYPHDSAFGVAPLYGDATPLSVDLKPGFYNVLPREDGLFDLVHGRWLTYHRHVGTLESPAFETTVLSLDADEQELEAYRIMNHGEKFVGDLNGDGLPDLMFCHVDRRKTGNPWLSRPAGVRPWETQRDARNGPSDDYENIGTFRVNDIEDQPTAKRNTLELRWAPGRLDAMGVLSFAAPRPVRLGHTDYPVMWEQYQNRAMPRVLRIDAGVFIALLEPMGRLVALPVLDADEEELHVGRATDLLASGRMFSALVKSGGTCGVVDLNGDGRDELLIRGGAFGGVVALAGDAVGAFKEVAVLRRTAEGAPMVGIELSAAERVDLDRDGFQDIIIGTAAGSLFIYAGTEDPLVYRGPFFATTPDGFLFLNRARDHDNLQGPMENSWGYLNPHAADYDGDGHLDLIVNDNTAYPQLYRGTGKRFDFVGPQAITLGAKPLAVQWRTKLAVISAEQDFAGSGVACLAFIDLDRGLSVAIPQSPGSPEIDRVVQLTTQDGQPLILCGFNGQSGRTKIALADWTGDGVDDLVFGTAGGLVPFVDPALPYDNVEFRDRFGFRQQAQPYVWENVGSNAQPAYASGGPRRLGLDYAAELDPALFRYGYHVFSIHPTNLDGDKQLDFIAADEKGYVRYFFDEQVRLAEPVRD